MLGKNNKKGGNPSTELYVLQVLNRIQQSIAGTGAPAPAGIATESTLQSVLAAISTSSQDLEVLLVRDTGNSDQVVQQIRELVGGTTTYEDVDGNAYIPVGPLVYLDPSAVLNLILTESISLNTTDFATETTLSNLNAKLNTLGQKASLDSAPVVLSTEQEVILNAIKTAVEALDLDADGLAQETTLVNTNDLLSTIDSVLDAIKVDSANLDVALSTRATEATLLLAKGVLDNIKLDTDNLDVALSTRSTEATLLATNLLLTTMDGVLDNILADTTAIATDVNTIATPVTGVATALLIVNVAGAATVAAGKRTISFFNSGNQDTTVNGSVLVAGTGITYPELSNRDLYAAIPYDSLTSELTITTVG